MGRVREKLDRPVTMFVGCLSFDREISGAAYSEAANQVQLEIIGNLVEQLGESSMTAVSLVPVPAFPNGPIVSHGMVANGVRQIGFLNLPILKHITFSIGLCSWLFSIRPQTVIVYNSFFFQNLALLLYRLLNGGAKLAVFVQDVLMPGRGWRSIQRHLDRYSVRFLSCVDLVLPISEHITADFKIYTPSFVIKGGLTRKIIDAFSFSFEKPAPRQIRRAVFAGGLEPHNGIDRLVEKWMCEAIDLELHVFGKGSLAHMVATAAEENPNIIFHGFASHDKIQEFVARSKFLFVLRFDAGIESKYFFPSKFWEAVASNSIVICNRFIGFPEDMAPYCSILDDELENIELILLRADSHSSLERVRSRRDHVIETHTWAAHVKKMLLTLNVT